MRMLMNDTCLVVIYLILLCGTFQVFSSRGVEFLFCNDDVDCEKKENSYCNFGICDCLPGARQLSDERCIATPEMIRPPGEAHAGDGKVKGTTAKDIIPDWALYLSIGCGFIGMLLIGIAVAQRSHNNEAERRLREQGEQLQMPTHPRRNLSLKPSPTLTNSQTATV